MSNDVDPLRTAWPDLFDLASVALVGNAPGTEAAAVDAAGSVVRFNNAPGFGGRTGSHITHLALVNRGGQMREWLADPGFLDRPVVRQAKGFVLPFPMLPEAHNRPEPICFTREALAMLRPLGKPIHVLPEALHGEARRVLGARAEGRPTRAPGSWWRSRSLSGARSGRPRSRPTDLASKAGPATLGRPSALGSPRRARPVGCGRILHRPTDDPCTMATLITVLKGGGRYDATWVARLAGGIRRHAPAFRRILCLTDLPLAIDGVERVELRHDRPAWWAKMEAFRPGLVDGTALLCDLDTVLTGPADALAEPGLAAMEDYFHKDHVSSALLRWHGDELSPSLRHLRGQARALDEAGTCGSVPNAVHGDQVVIDHLLRRQGRKPLFFQHRYPTLLDFYDPRRDTHGPVVIFIGEAKPDTACGSVRAAWLRS
ncbi:hypothetical protein MMMDOFMJ_2822 [Methylobacterium gnaphalii]|uniref:Uncharacterized protein n=1 Tax=Methylobacterium gnaphalii TaxID=1010610 RepID=A0A512JQX5_9HYPH|nr:hypothetical protein [Methylobacterium gnaphalii]GEP12367.1 hypothetical protein MGN01_42120 [Methylobacterium gnaphalii]GJD69883.1 hypothetical protein MMMDOFMJ_2822 [Methylobacterium gnaphalii]GLS51690.1 hypothetical protein GCM10007885_45510 [Methylobacterium gnaphalii]